MIAGVYCVTGINIESNVKNGFEYVICLASSKGEADSVLKKLKESKSCMEKYKQLKVRPYKDRYAPAELLLPLKQYQHFIKLFIALNTITKEYSSPAQLKRNAEKEYGLDYESALEMAYENIQEEAKSAIKGFRLKDLQSLIEIYKFYESKDGK